MAIALVLVSCLSFSIAFPDQVEQELTGVKMNIEDGVQIIKSKSYTICSNAKWSEMQTAGVKMTETSLKGFFQICERIASNLGNLQVYVDLEARVMWVYSDTSNEGADTEAYYVQFT